jgi:hydrogenase maturation protein HypF
MRTRRQIDVRGMVQGVGFRPYIYRLASDRSLTGSVRNTSEGVTIQLEGVEAAIDEFLDRLPREVPPLAHITALRIQEIPCNGDREFLILESDARQPARTLISPDVAVCKDCLRELFDPANRRYRYPFINCTNCGPRFTIIRQIPYDRPCTSMSEFQMCAECAGEYADPRDRRFHAQPNACWKCGPQLEFLDSEGKAIAANDPVAEAIGLLRIGKIVAIKGLGGFHLAVDAMNPDAVQRLRARKHRFEKPLAVMVADADAARKLCEVDAASLAALESAARPIVLMPKRERSGIAEEVTRGLTELGVFLPYTPVHHLLFESREFPALVMTSANLSEEPIVISNREALERLHGLADFFLVHNRDILWRCDDSVVRAQKGSTRQIRRSRGYVPAPISLPIEAPALLAVGGELKNTICLTKGREAFPSQHIGDLENLESYRFFQDVIAHLEQVLEIHPRAIAYDLHPEYLSTKWALEQAALPRIGVQHHHAHIASCMAENGLEGKVLGFALDGTGYGTDGHVWGGEALVADYVQFQRAGHFENIPMPGGEQAIREPWRMALAYLNQHFGSELWNMPISFVRALEKRETGAILRMIGRGVNCPLTSSCGRLFDAVAALIGIRSRASYEGQAAVELEIAASRAPAETNAYALALRKRGGTWIFETAELFEAVVQDLAQATPREIISARFHQGLIKMFSRLADLLREQTSLNRICLSGGTFQNRIFFEGLSARLESAGFEVFTHSQVPCGDGGLSLGQAVVASHRVM